jgi:hypothetical protein
MAACSTTHKVTTTHVVTSDSTVATTKDTASKVTNVTRDKALEIQDFTFHIQYANGDTVSRTVPALKIKQPTKGVPASDPVDDELRAALATFNTDHSAIESVDGHIGDLREVVDYSDKVDSQGVKTTGTTQVKHADTTVVAKVTKTSLPVWLIIGAIALVVLTAGVWVVKKFVL